MPDRDTHDTTHLDEGTIHAWLDGALGAPESATVERHLAACAECRAEVAEARGMIAAAGRILSALDDVPAGVIPDAEPASIERIRAAARTRDRQRLGAIQRYGAIAAVLTVAALGAAVVRRANVGTARTSMHRAPASVQPQTSQSAAPSGVEATPTRARVSATLDSAASTPSQRARSAEPSLGPSRVAAASPAVDSSRGGALPDSSAIHSEHQRDAGRQVASALAERAVAAAAPPAPPPSGADAQRSGAPVLIRGANAITANDAPVRHSIGGRVIDSATGRPLESVAISVVGSPNGAYTDANGNFTIAGVAPGSHAIKVRRIGYDARAVDVDPASPASGDLTIALAPSGSALTEVVVTGAAIGRRASPADTPPPIDGAVLRSSDVSRAGDTLVRRSVYELQSGALVTLIARRVAPVATLNATTAPSTVDAKPGAMYRGRSSAPSVPREPAAARAAVLSAPAPGAPLHSIRWTAPDGTSLTLSGPLTEAELDSLRHHVSP